MGQQLKQSTAYNIPFFMIDSTDSVTGKTGLSPTVTLNKNNLGFNAAGGSVTESGSGWYNLAANTADTATLGPLLLHATATGADPWDEAHQVLVDIPGGSVSSVTGSVGSVTGAVGSVTGNVGGNVVGSVASVTGAVGSVTGNVGGNVVGSVGSVVGLTAANLDTTISSRLSTTHFDTILGTPAVSVSADIAEIEAETDGIAAIPTNPLLTTDTRLNNLDATISSRLASASYTAPDNTTIATINTKIGAPASTISGDIAGVNTTVNFIEALNL